MVRTVLISTWLKSGRALCSLNHLQLPLTLRGSERNFSFIAGNFHIANCKHDRSRILKRIDGVSTSFRVVPLRYQSSESPKKESKIPVTWKSVGITAVIGGIFLYGMLLTKKEKEKEIFRQRQKQIGKAKIGGEWELTDMNGKPRTSKEFLGSWLLIYFGFTHCPDICPDEIEKMMKTRDILEKRIKDVNFETLFITVDPARDDIAAVKRYCKDFSPRLLGLTGTPDQINNVAKAFRVYYSAGAADEENDYIVDHTIIIYLIDSEGKFVDYYGQTKTADQMADHIESHVNRHKYLTV